MAPFWRHKTCETVKLCVERALKTLGLRQLSHSSTVSQGFFLHEAAPWGVQRTRAGVVAGAVAECGDVFMDSFP
jgi:hypothetical protein